MVRPLSIIYFSHTIGGFTITRISADITHDCLYKGREDSDSIFLDNGDQWQFVHNFTYNCILVLYIFVYIKPNKNV